MEDWLYQVEKRRKWLESLPDGVPCDHRGCLSHISHPCEGCGRIGGKRLTEDVMDYELGIVLRRYWVRSWDCKVCGFTNHRDDPDTCVLCYSPRRPTKRAGGHSAKERR